MVDTKNEWETPDAFFNKLNKFYDFDLDAAAREHNTKCNKFLTNAFKETWNGNTIWCNPPYSGYKGLEKWIGEFITQSYIRNRIIVLVPASTDTFWWQQAVKRAKLVVFLKQRITFKGAPNNARFPCCLIIYGKQEPDAVEWTFLQEVGTVWQPQTCLMSNTKN